MTLYESIVDEVKEKQNITLEQLRILLFGKGETGYTAESEASAGHGA